jgi:hypothetical protein
MAQLPAHLPSAEPSKWEVHLDLLPWGFGPIQTPPAMETTSSRMPATFPLAAGPLPPIAVSAYYQNYFGQN